MKKTKLVGIEVEPKSRLIVLEQIKKYLQKTEDHLQVISLNPENLVIAGENDDFKRVIESSQIQIADGIGVVLAGKIFGQVWPRFTGVDLMEDLVKLADELSLRVVLIGGKPNLADKLAKCYSAIYARAKFKGIEAIKNIKNPLKAEENRLFSIVTDYKPHIILVSFGSPEQELWLDRHKKQFPKMVTVGVGGAFDYLSGKIVRAPVFLRALGLEWLFRLVREPWRWRRQLRLIKFAYLILKQKFELD